MKILNFTIKEKNSKELMDLFNETSDIYGCTFEEVKKATLSFPPFAGYNHERVVREGVEVYGVENEDKVKKAILSHPQFAGLNHERVVREKTRLGRLAGLSKGEAINLLLDKPVLTGYSAKRYIAALDIGRHLESEGFPQDERMLKAFSSYFGKSPYVPNTLRKRISQVKRENMENYKEPPLITAMRKRLENLSCRT